jgi:hypothetical protein
MKRKSILFWSILILPLILLIGFSIWAYTPLGPMPEAVAALQPSAEVQVYQDDWLIFEPKSGEFDAGLLIYPGGRVDPRSYAPTAHQIAEQGYLVVIVPMPFNLAVFGWQNADPVIEDYPAVSNWVISGHSLGGSMAAKYALSHPTQISGLALWASYPAASDDLSNSSLKSMSVYATNDGLTSLQDIDNSRQLMPLSTHWIPVEGGNHAQFGWYGDQPGDNPATISRVRQQEILIESTLDLMKESN